MNATKLLKVTGLGLIAACLLQTGVYANDSQIDWQIQLIERSHTSAIVGEVVCGGNWTCSAEKPVQCFVRFSTNKGKAVFDVKTTTDGWFDAMVLPGTYIVTPYCPPSGKDPGIVGQPLTVTVTKNNPVAVQLCFFPIAN